MSRIGKKPIELKTGILVSQQGRDITVSGPKGALSFTMPNGIDISLEDKKIMVSGKNKDENTRTLLGLTRATLANMAKGVETGFEKKLELVGVGFRAQVSGSELILSVGYSHPVKIQAPEGITFTVSENIVTVSGIDKSLVGNTAARIRAVRKPEPYKGKGIRYAGEYIRRKAGKAAKAVGAVK